MAPLALHLPLARFFYSIPFISHSSLKLYYIPEQSSAKVKSHGDCNDCPKLVSRHINSRPDDRLLCLVSTFQDLSRPQSSADLWFIDGLQHPTHISLTYGSYELLSHCYTPLSPFAAQSCNLPHPSSPTRFISSALVSSVAIERSLAKRFIFGNILCLNKALCRSRLSLSAVANLLGRNVIC